MKVRLAFQTPYISEIIWYFISVWHFTSLMAESAVQETWVQSLGWEVLLEKGMPTHSSILVWRIPLTEEPGRLQSMGSQRVRHYWATNTFTFTYPLCPSLLFQMPWFHYFLWLIIINHIHTYTHTHIYVYISDLLYPLICWQTLSLLLYLGYCE